MSTTAIKNVDEQLYRKVKALASLNGSTVGEAVNEALRLWVQLTAKRASVENWARLEEEARSNNKAYESEERRLLATHRGQYVAVALGKILGTFKKEKEAFKAIQNAGVKHGIVTRIEEKPKRMIELGWSIMEQFT